VKVVKGIFHEWAYQFSSTDNTLTFVRKKVLPVFVRDQQVLYPFWYTSVNEHNAVAEDICFGWQKIEKNYLI